MWRRARSEKKKHCSLEVSQLFLSEAEAMINILNDLLQHYAAKNIIAIKNNILFNIIIHSKYFPDSDWLKALV